MATLDRAILQVTSVLIDIERSRSKTFADAIGEPDPTIVTPTLRALPDTRMFLHRRRSCSVSNSPSSRIASPLSIGLSTICAASSAYSVALPSREG